MESNKNTKFEDKKSNAILENRKKLSLTGVVEVISFDEEKINLNTNLGMLVIKGEELKMNKLDVQNGDVIITGHISSMVYSGNEIKAKKQKGFLARLFR